MKKMFLFENSPKNLLSPKNVRFLHSLEYKVNANNKICIIKTMQQEGYLDVTNHIPADDSGVKLE